MCFFFSFGGMLREGLVLGGLLCGDVDTRRGENVAVCANGM